MKRSHSAIIKPKELRQWWAVRAKTIPTTTRCSSSGILTATTIIIIIIIIITAGLCVDLSCYFLFSSLRKRLCRNDVLCKDSKTSAVRNFGDTWMRWRGPRAEYCRCAARGKEQCHYVPVESRCYNGGVCKKALYSSDFLCQCPPSFSGTQKHDGSSLGLGNHNFCRNPDNDSVPWCFVYKGAQVDWQYCGMDKCPE
ncbi:hypothetical protein CRUP_029282, partial [Coryphaenoides rupestris]